MPGLEKLSCRFAASVLLIDWDGEGGGDGAGKSKEIGGEDKTDAAATEMGADGRGLRTFVFQALYAAMMGPMAGWLIELSRGRTMASSDSHPGSWKRFEAKDVGGAVVAAVTADGGRGKGWEGGEKVGAEAREGGGGSAGFNFGKILGSRGRT